jgi:hypothetical protein
VSSDACLGQFTAEVETEYLLTLSAGAMEVEGWDGTGSLPVNGLQNQMILCGTGQSDVDKRVPGLPDFFPTKLHLFHGYAI